LQQITFKGKIITGIGEGKAFVNLEWVKNQIQKKLKFSAYPGTLNLIVKQSKNLKSLFEKSQNCRIFPQEGFCEGIIIPALINSQKCAIIIPKIKNYPENMVEIISPINLRKKFRLKDGDEVIVTFFI
jgi:riboflavin kinase